MSFMLGADNLKLHRIAGGTIISHAPLYGPTADTLFLISECAIHVYSTTTGEHVRALDDSSHKLIGMELDLFNEDILIGCTENGEIFYWKWSTGELKRKLQLKIPQNSSACCTHFNQLNWCGDSESANVLVLCKMREGKMQWHIFETTRGNIVKVPCNLSLNEKPAIAAVNTKSAFKIICIAQESRIYFINYTTWKWIGLTNGLSIPITCLKWHPAEEMIATGDNLGRIFLWREFWDKTTVKNRLYHWHSTPVTSVAFTQSGSGFYSSGFEAVVVIWNVDRPEIRKFVPHITCVVKHIAVSNANIQIAISTLDNGVQILGNDHNIKCNIQEFTFAMEDETGKRQFPVGLRMNPRSNALVLNGRMGHLQFYSPHTQSLLYNVDIVGQNQLRREQGKILYNVQVTKAAFNIDWMATGEVFNDEEHFPEVRLKFWKYLEESHSYALNTSIELPHEGGFNAIEFSSAHQVDNLLCGTVGHDNMIKVWALEETDNIYKKGKVWFCIAQANYKNQPIESISFSHDGSLLAAGCGNTLCIFKANTLKIKAALNTSPGMDGSVSKAQVRFAMQRNQLSSEELSKERNNLMQFFSNAMDCAAEDDTLLKKFKDKMKTNEKNHRIQASQQSSNQQQSDHNDKSALFRRIMNTHQLNLFQQILLFQRLGIQCQVSPSWHDKMLNYLKETVDNTGIVERINNLNARVRRLNMRHRFKAKYRLQEYIKRSKNIKDINSLSSILSALGLKDTSSPSSNDKSIQRMDIDDDDDNDDEEEGNLNKIESENAKPYKITANIRHVQFAANEHGHLILVCTESRVLVWNLLTLRLENVLKLSATHLAFDPITNLAAVFTKNHELHIFQPNVPMPVYQRQCLPNIQGAVWLPRRNSKSSSIHVDWQSQSHLYMFTDSQEIFYLHNPQSENAANLPSVTFKNPVDTVGLRYSTFGTFATKQISGKSSTDKKSNGPLIVGNAGKTAVKVLVEMSTHTMPPIGLMCNEFLKSLVKPVDSAASTAADKISRISRDSRQSLNGEINGNLNGKFAHDSSDDDLADDEARGLINGIAGNSKSSSKINAEAYRKSIVIKTDEIKAKYEKNKTKEQIEKRNIETHLKKIAELNLDLEFNGSLKTTNSLRTLNIEL